MVADSQKPAGMDEAKSKLDQAVQEYYAETSRLWGNRNPGMIIGWTLGIAINRIDSDGDMEEAIQVESMPHIGNYTARGIADATAEAFQSQASGYGEFE